VIGALALIAQLSIVAHAPENVAACEAFEVSVTVTVLGPTPPYVIPPSFGYFDVLRSSPTPTMTPAGPAMSTAEFRYVLTTERTGSFTLGPFEARVGGVVAKSRPLTINVRPTAASGRVPTVVARARVDTSLEVNFRALALPETVYVGQQANYEVAVFLNETVRDRLRRNPTFFPPDMQSMLAYDIPAPPGEPPRRKVGSRCFDALVYQRALFPLLPGRFVIPPAQLVYSLPLSSSFFSREESHELRTDSTVIIALDPPVHGRPDDYSGAVGDLSLDARLDTARARVGDPLVLTLRVAGSGNVKLLPRPRVDVPWATVVNGDERVDVDTAARRIRGAKDFDFLLTPRIAGELDLPPIRYPYFNPDRRRYELATSRQRHIRVGAGTLAAADTAQRDRVYALRERYRGPLAPPAQRRPVFWAILAIAPLPALGLRTRRRTPRVAAAPSSASRLKALSRASVTRDPCDLRRAYVGALAERLGLNAEVFTRPGALARALRRAGVSTELAADAERYLRTLDEAAYSSSGTLPPKASARAFEIYQTADREALPRHELRLSPSALFLVLFLVAGGAALAASPADDPQANFDRGVQQYGQGHYAVARDYFLRSARAATDAPDAWANAGTAAWASADTATSVVGWQRALRLEPLAGDMRDRLTQLRPASFDSDAFVAPVPPSLVAWLALALWCAAWGFDVWRSLRRRRRPVRMMTTLLVVAVLLALVAIDLNDRQDARSLFVVRRTVPLATSPALGAEVLGNAETGEIGRMVGRDGVWTRLRLDDAREGWIATANLVSLDLNATPAD
jgi:oxygen tolerance protein BatD